MAGVSRKISELDLAAPLVLTDQLEVERGATDNLRTSVSDLKALIHSAFTMQNGYDNSSTSQIITSTPLGAVDIQRGSAADTDAVLRVLTGGGAPSFAVFGNGDVETIGSFINIGSGSAGAKILILQDGITSGGVRYTDSSGLEVLSTAVGDIIEVLSDAGVLNATYSGGIGAELLALVGNLDVGGDVDVVGSVSIASLLTIGDGTGVVDVILKGDNLQDIDLDFMQETFLRWKLRLRKDSGSNDFNINRYNSSGVFQGTPFAIDAGTGNITISKDLGVSGDANIVGDLDVGGILSGGQVGINLQSGTTYTFILADNSKLVTMGNAAATTVTVPPNVDVAYPIGSQITVAQTGAGQVTFAPGSGVTINSAGSDLKLSAQYSSATLIKISTNVWLLVGDLTT